MLKDHVERATLRTYHVIVLCGLLFWRTSNILKKSFSEWVNALQVVQEFILGRFDPEATAAYNRELSDVSTLKDPRSKDAAQRYAQLSFRRFAWCLFSIKFRLMVFLQVSCSSIHQWNHLWHHRSSSWNWGKLTLLVSECDTILFWCHFYVC